jgi:hypothetical protein
LLPFLIMLGVVLGGCSQTKRDWENALQQDNAPAYRAYLGKYAQGEHAQEARQRLDDCLWRETQKTPTIDACLTYLQESPGGRFVQQAKEKMDSLQFAKLSENIVCRVGVARLVSLPGTDEAFESRWNSISSLFSSPCEGWQVEGNFSQHVTATNITGHEWRFVLVSFVLENTGDKIDKVKISTKGGTCPDIILTVGPRQDLSVWEAVMAGMFGSHGEFNNHLKRHAAGIIPLAQYDGTVYAELAPHKQTWVAVLLGVPPEMRVDTWLGSKLTLSVHGVPLPVVIPRPPS